jgi:hypothetical protein
VGDFYPKEKPDRRVMRPGEFERDRRVAGWDKKIGAGQSIERAKRQRELMKPDGSK